MESKFLQKLEKVLLPIGNRIGNQRHLAAVSAGMMMTLGFMVVGSIFLIMAHPPVNLDLVSPDTGNIFLKFLVSWKKFAMANYGMITKPFSMTMGMLGLLTSFTIAFSLGKFYKLNEVNCGMISTVIFLMVAAPLDDGKISTGFLGADGLFAAIIVALVSVEITKFVTGKNWGVQRSENIPEAVVNFINSMIPLLANIILIYGLNVVLMVFAGKDLPNFVLTLLTPALNIGNSLWGYMAIILFSNILWLLGVNGTSIIFPIIFTLGITNTGINGDLVGSSKTPEMIMNLQMFRFAILGGAGNTIGLILLMMKSRSEHLKTLGKLSIVPGICGINEPVIFGSPIVLNPILSIPFLIAPIVSVVLGYLAQKYQIISMGYIVDPSFTPFFVQAYLSSLDFRNVLFVFFLVVTSVLIYYPFFKIYEKRIMESA